MDWVHVFRVSDGRIHSMREYNDTARMLAAFQDRP
jgi:ketosteroid isomerase-like protein